MVVPGAFSRWQELPIEHKMLVWQTKHAGVSNPAHHAIPQRTNPHQPSARSDPRRCSSPEVHCRPCPL